MVGSIVRLMNADGNTVFSASYDAWGKRTIINNTFAFHRGYTGHEHLPEFGLINMNGRMYDPVLGRFLSPDPFVQAPDFSQNFNRYSYCLNNPLKYTDPSGYVFGIDDLIIIAAFAYFGGMQANFAHAVEHGTNPFNPGNWNWKSAHTYIGMAGGAMDGAAMAGYAVPYLQVPGMIPNGSLQAGIQVTLNGIGNVTDGHNFFDNWYWSAGMGFVSGAYTGYGLAKEKGLNYWWGNEVKYGRTQWSFLTSEKPYETVSWDIKNVGSLKQNDCVPTTLLENDNYFGGNLTYEQALIDAQYVDGKGAWLNKEGYKNILSNRFNVSNMGSTGLSDPNWVRQNIIDNGSLIDVNWKYGGQGRHSDVLRSIKYYSNKTVLQFRIGSYNLKSVDSNGWFFIIKGLKWKKYS